MMQLRALLEDVLTFIPEGGGARAIISQTISDYAIGLDLTDVLSKPFSPEYMFQHMGGLEGPDEQDREILRDVEAYKLVFTDEERRFVVDRRSIYQANEEKANYIPERDCALIQQALRDWFARLIIATRAQGADHSVVTQTLEEAIVLRFGIGECLKYGMLHNCFKFPGLYVHGSSPKQMYIELYATGNTRHNSGRNAGERRPSFPYHHLWEYEELEFRMRYVTYSDKKYLTVHMPGYS